VRVARPADPPAIRAPLSAREQRPAGYRSAFVAASGALESVPVYKRTALAAGQRITGPAVIEERESTTILGKGDTATIDKWGCILIDVALPKTLASNERAESTA
jgi:N-methylhydantoinase A/oxoprolinase/acetone carboxylase beta subunit